MFFGAAGRRGLGFRACGHQLWDSQRSARLEFLDDLQYSDLICMVCVPPGCIPLVKMTSEVPAWRFSRHCPQSALKEWCVAFRGRVACSLREGHTGALRNTNTIIILKQQHVYVCGNL